MSQPRNSRSIYTLQGTKHIHLPVISEDVFPFPKDGFPGKYLQVPNSKLVFVSCSACILVLTKNGLFSIHHRMHLSFGTWIRHFSTDPSFQNPPGSNNENIRSNFQNPQPKTSHINPPPLPTKRKIALPIPEVLGKRLLDFGPKS